MKRKSTILLVTLAAGGLAVAAAVSAAPPFGGCQQGPGGGAMMQGEGVGPGMHGRGPQGRHDPARQAERMERMRGHLQITAEQEPAWQAFVAQMDAQRARMQAHHAQMKAQWDGDSGTSMPQRMQQRTALMGERLAAMGEVSAALETLYGQLTPEQQARLDRAPMMMGGGRHGMRGF